MGDLDGFVLRMIGGQHAILHSFCAIDREVAVEFDHGVTRLDGLVGIDLDLIVVLSVGSGSAKPHHRNQIEDCAEDGSACHNPVIEKVTEESNAKRARDKSSKPILAM